MSSPVASAPTTDRVDEFRPSSSLGQALLYVISRLWRGATHHRIAAAFLALLFAAVVGFFALAPTIFGSSRQAAAANRQAAAANRQAAAANRQTCVNEATSISSTYSTNGHRLSLAQVLELTRWEERGCPSPGPGL
jgi:hypothetical protein